MPSSCELDAIPMFRAHRHVTVTDGRSPGTGFSCYQTILAIFNL